MTALAIGTSGPDGRDAARWGLSFAAILGLHAALLAGILAYRPAAIEPGEALPAVMIDMAPPPAAPSVAPADMPPSEAVPEAALPDPVPDAPPDVPEPDVAPPTPTIVAEVPPPEPLPDLPPDPKLQPPPVVQERAAVALPPPLPRAAPPPKRIVEKTEARKPPKPVQARRAERQEARRPPSQEAGAQTTASIPSQSSGSSAASRSSWQGAIVAALNRAKRPQGETGLASVRFSIDRGGRVLSASLAGSAGSASLDGEAVGLVRRAGLPSAPPDVAGSTFTFTVPIRFTSR